MVAVNIQPRLFTLIKLMQRLMKRWDLAKVGGVVLEQLVEYVKITPMN